MTQGGARTEPGGKGGMHPPTSPNYIHYTEHCSVWSYQFYRYYYRQYYADEKVSADEKGRFLNLDF